MAHRRWSDLKAGLPKSQQERIKKRADEIRQEILEEDLRGIRELVGKTQTEVAVAMNVTQGRVSEAERREDHLLSTVRSYVEALGGELEVIARFGDKTIRLKAV